VCPTTRSERADRGPASRSRPLDGIALLPGITALARAGARNVPYPLDDAVDVVVEHLAGLIRKNEERA